MNDPMGDLWDQLGFNDPEQLGNQFGHYVSDHARDAFETYKRDAAPKIRQYMKSGNWQNKGQRHKDWRAGTHKAKKAYLRKTAPKLRKEGGKIKRAYLRQTAPKIRQAAREAAREEARAAAQAAMYSMMGM